MKKQWFILQTLTSKENKVLESIKARIGQEQMQDYFGQVLVPVEKVTEQKNGKKRTVNKKVFPGYVLVEMALYDETKKARPGEPPVYDRVWQFLRETPGLISSWLMRCPPPLKDSEVAAILSDKPAGKEDKPVVKFDFSVGDTVKVNDGAFMGMTGIVSMTDPDRGKLKLDINVFGRTVPVDVEGWQVDKLTEEELLEMNQPQS